MLLQANSIMSNKRPSAAHFVQDCVFANNTVNGYGGGIALGTPSDVEEVVTCPATPEYWRFTHDTTVTVVNTVLVNNSALCGTCGGGGMYVASGGAVQLDSCQVRHHHDGDACSCEFGAATLLTNREVPQSQWQYTSAR